MFASCSGCQATPSKDLVVRLALWTDRVDIGQAWAIWATTHIQYTWPQASLGPRLVWRGKERDKENCAPIAARGRRKGSLGTIVERRGSITQCADRGLGTDGTV